MTRTRLRSQITWRQKKQAQAKILINKDAEDILKARKAELRAELSLDAKRDEFGDRNMISIMCESGQCRGIGLMQQCAPTWPAISAHRAEYRMKSCGI